MSVTGEATNNLTAAEAAAIKEYDEAQLNELEEIIGDDDEDETAGGDQGAGDDDAGDQGATEVTTIPLDTETIQAPPEVPDVDFIQQPFRFVDDGNLLPDIEQRIEEIGEKLMEGEITYVEAKKAEVALMAENANRKQDAAFQEWSNDLWTAECQTFYKHNPTWTPDKLNPVVWGAFDGEVIRIRNDPRYQNYTGLQKIYLAQQAVSSAFGMEGPATNKGQKAPQMPRPDLKTLSHIPAADVNETSEDEFSAVDKLTGAALERAIGKMTPDQKQRYLHGQG
jgi:hypothetical protein